MIPNRLTELMNLHGDLEIQKAHQIFHAQNFDATLFMLKKGFVKRYQVTKSNHRVIELIYGPGHIFPLSQLYRTLFGVEQNQEDLIYVYQTMTDIEILRMNDDRIVSELDNDPRLYADLFYEAGLRLKSNIDRLASNALQDDYMKVAHQFICLANEFGADVTHEGKPAIKILVPLEPIDMAEQLNISVEVTEAIMSSLNRNKLINIKNKFVYVLDVAQLKDIYLS